MQSEQSIPLAAVLHPLTQHQLLHVSQILKIRESKIDFVYSVLKRVLSAQRVPQKWTPVFGKQHAFFRTRKQCRPFSKPSRGWLLNDPHDKPAFDGPLASGRFET